MLSREEQEILSEKVQEILGEDFNVYLEGTDTLNDQKKEGLVISKKEERGKIIFYMEDIICCEKGECSLDEIGQKIVYMYLEKRPDFQEIRKFEGKMEQWEQVRHNVYPLLLKYDKNRELLKTLIWMPVLDLAVCYSICNPDLKKDMDAIFRVDKGLFEKWEITLDELHRQAVENLKNDNYRAFSLGGCCVSFLTEGRYKAEPLTHLEEGGMYVFTNGRVCFGAAGIIDMDHLWKITEGRDCIILPCSVHEVILVIEDGISDVEEYNMMIGEVNQSDVEPEEQLSDHAYYFDGKQKLLKIA